MRALGRELEFNEKTVRRHVRWYALDGIRLLQDCPDNADLQRRVTPGLVLRCLDYLDRTNQRDGLELWVRTA